MEVPRQIWGCFELTLTIPLTSTGTSSDDENKNIHIFHKSNMYV